MCDPTMIAVTSFATTAASAIAGYQGQKANYAQQNQQYLQNITNANEAVGTRYAYDQLRMQQDGQVALQQKTEAEINAMKARSTTTVAAGEAGVVGLSVDHLLGDYYAREGRFNESVDTNLDMQNSAMVGQMQAEKAGAQNQINSVAKPQKPSFLDAGLRILGGAASAAGGYYTQTAQRRA